MKKLVEDKLIKKLSKEQFALAYKDKELVEAVVFVQQIGLVPGSENSVFGEVVWIPKEFMVREVTEEMEHSKTKERHNPVKMFVTANEFKSLYKNAHGVEPI